MMATARISAEVVLGAAHRLHEVYSDEQKKKRDEWFREEGERVYTTGFWWWKRRWSRTRAELDSQYASGMLWGTSPDWYYRDMANKAARLRDIASAAMNNGDGFVSLDAAQVRFLGLEKAPS